MKTLRVIDEIGNKTDCETEFVPRIGERIELDFGRGRNAPITTHYYRVKDVVYRLAARAISKPLFSSTLSPGPPDSAI